MFPGVGTSEAGPRGPGSEVGPPGVGWARPVTSSPPQRQENVGTKELRWYLLSHGPKVGVKS